MVQVPQYARDGIVPEAAGLPGYRRRLLVEPRPGQVRALLEDDFHCMAVTLRHDGRVVTAIEPDVRRAPWNTCPGAELKLVETFAGLPLANVTARRDKKQNCTHLHDLAVLAAAHALDEAQFTYDVFVSDPANGERILEICRNGELLLKWVESDGVMTEPQEIRGLSLLSLRDWIAGLSASEQEPARLLQWSALVAHGRTLPMEEQSRATRMPANCFTFQPQRASHAVRIGESIDFSDGSHVPLTAFDGKTYYSANGSETSSAS